MSERCEICGRTECEAMADAKTLGLYEELKGGVYTCCQIAAWADEQRLAWSEATREDASRSEGFMDGAELQAETALVPGRFRRPVPWFRNS
jgi:hypothetical protein